MLMYTPGYATRTLLHRLYSISTTKMHTLAYAHCHTVIRTVTCAPTPVDSSCTSVNSGVAMYLFIARVPLNIAQVPLNIVPIAHVASIAIPGFTDAASRRRHT